jgi:LysM repeat protein
MDAKPIFLAILMMPCLMAMAQEKEIQAPKSDLEVLKAQIKENEERINKLSQEIARLSEAIKQKQDGTVTKAEPTGPPAASSASGGMAGVDNPTLTEGKTHIVAKGETLSQISKAYGVTVEDIKQLNKIEDAKKLQVDQTIKIPNPPNAFPRPSTAP